MPLRKASRTEPYLMVGVRGCGRGAASSAKAALEPSNATPQAAMRLDVRIGFRFGSTARMGHGAVPRRTDVLRVFPKVARSCRRTARLPFRVTARQFFVRDFHVNGTLDGVEGDDVAIPHQRDRPTDRSFRARMADAEAARRAGEPTISDERDLVAHSLSVKRRRGG